MNSIKKASMDRVAAAALSGAAVVLAPTVALAEGPSGADLLLPKPAEFIPALVAFLIIWVVLAKLAWPSILGMMEKRQQKIEDDLNDAARIKQEAADDAKAYQARIAEAHKEAEEIIANAKKDAEAQRAEIMAKAQRDAAEVVMKAHDAVAGERRKAMIELSGSVVDLSVEIAGKIIGSEMSEDAQRKLAEKYLAEVSGANEQ